MNWSWYVTIAIWVVTLVLAIFNVMLHRKRKQLRLISQKLQQQSNELWYPSSVASIKGTGSQGLSTVPSGALVPSVYWSGSSSVKTVAQASVEGRHRLSLLQGNSEGFNQTIDLLFRATDLQWKTEVPPRHDEKCSAVMSFNDQQTPESAREWFRRAFELTL